ncbi:MAG: hypothetical protein KC442_25385, partial [Thermomicrobiales bacterium]|nr:hypothetical protein [Thermomicrobiales bacterium]
MSKVTGFLLCALLAFVSGAVTPADAPAQDLPGSITLPYDASLQEGPSDDALSLGMALTGSVVSLTGAPVNNYYPVEVGGIAGWIRGDALALNEVPIEAEEGEAAAATPVSTEAAPAGDMVADVPVETA